MITEKRISFWIVLVVAMLVGYQNCSLSGGRFQGVDGENSTPSLPAAANVSGNGGTYDGKIRVLHHYVDNFTCEGRSEPESILIRKNETDWVLVQNTPTRCRAINEAPVTGVVFDDVAKRASYDGKTYIAPRPYFVQVVADANTPDADLFDGVCEDIQGKCSLRAAIQQASATTSTSSVLVHVPAGTYALTSPLNLQFLTSKNSVTVRGENVSNTILDGANSFSHFRILGLGAPVYFENLSFVHGSNSTRQQASALWVESLNGNTYTGPVGVTNCVFRNNSGNAPIYTVVSSGPTTVRKSVIDSNNSAGIYTGGNIFTIEDTVISNNAAGGIRTDFASSMFVIRGSSIVGNSGPGALISNCYNCVMENVTIAGNKSAGLQVYTSVTQSQSYDFTMTNSTLYGNGATADGSLSFYYQDPSNKMVINNSIVAAGNSAVSACSWVGIGTHTIVATNSIFDDTSCAAGGTGNLIADPKFAPLASNGGLTPTLLPLMGSPAIDGGDNRVCLATDQRGISRPIDKLGSGPRCDIGSVEVQ